MDDSWMVPCEVQDCGKYYCYLCSWSTMKNLNRDIDPEGGNMNLCLSHLNNGEIIVGSILCGEEEYTPDYWPKMPQPMVIKSNGPFYADIHT
jgi:hypothetical protein